MNALLKRLTSAETAPPWSLPTALLACAAALALIILGTLVGGAWFGTPLDPLPPVAQFVGWLIGAVLTALYVLQTRRKAEDRAALRAAESAAPLPLVMFLAFGAAIAVDLLALVVTGVFAPAPELLAFSAPTAGFREWAVVITLMVVAQPVADELAFRGVLLPSLRTALGPLPGWLAQAVVYAAFHYLAFTPTYTQGGIVPLWYGLVTPLLEGLVFGFVRVATGSTRAAIFAHIAFGLFAVAKLVILAA